MSDIDPFLPPASPTDNPVEARGGFRRTIIVWLTLVILFGALYNLFRSPSTHPVELPRCETSLSTTVLSWLPLAVFFAVVSFFWRRARRGNQRFQVLVEPAQLALIDQNPARARELNLELAKKLKGHQAANVRCNAAICAMRMGDFVAARDELLAVEQTAGRAFVDGLRLYVACELARLFTLLGETDRARAWMTSARDRLARSGHERLTFAESLLLTEVALLAREGDPAGSLERLEKGWLRISRRDEVGLALLLRAHLVASTSSPRDAGGAASYLSALRTLGVDLQYAEQAWPALRDTRLAS